MKIKINYFGQMAEMTGKSNELIEVDENSHTRSLQNLLEEKYKFNGLNYRIALNMDFTEENSVIKEDDEIALLPPFAGG